MKIAYSAAVELALGKALVIAGQRGSAEVGPTDLLRALLHEEEGQPVVLAQAAGVRLDKLRSLFPLCDGSGEAAADVRLAPPAAAILANARELARLHGTEGSVSSDLLFLAILEADAFSRSLLEGIGLDFAVLRNRIVPPTEPLRLEGSLDLTPPSDSIHTARIVDASANRAREALRVLEDFTRFVLADAFLSAQLKSLRHQLAEALGLFPADLLLQARDTVHDVGTAITTAQEQQRASPLAVARANAKRLQEALRSLEEFGKVLDPAFGQAIEQLRYHSYILERALVGRTDPHGLLAQARLYVLVAEALCRTSTAGTVRDALAGGAQVIQLREKTLDDRALLDAARDIRKMTHSAGALFIVNDRADIALCAEADGVHLGQNDLPVQEARRLLGPNAIIGVSTHNLQQVRDAILAGASYLGVGPTFPSQTKQFDDFPGLEFVRQVARETSLPAFVLGGVTAGNVTEVLAAGGMRLAASHAVCSADDVQVAARKLRTLLDASPM